jgi:predicted transcriptional regulator
MTTIGGKFTIEKRNLVTYIEQQHYEALKELARLHGRSVSAEAAAAIRRHLKSHSPKTEKDVVKV